MHFEPNLGRKIGKENVIGREKIPIMYLTKDKEKQTHEIFRNFARA